MLIRESGTEPLIRVMAEGEDEAMVSEVVDSLCAVIADAARQRVRRRMTPASSPRIAVAGGARHDSADGRARPSLDRGARS